MIYTLLPIQDLLVSVLQSLLILDTASLKLHVLALEATMLGCFRQLNILLDLLSDSVRVELVCVEFGWLEVELVNIHYVLASHLCWAFDLIRSCDVQKRERHFGSADMVSIIIDHPQFILLFTEGSRLWNLLR